LIIVIETKEQAKTWMK